MRKHFADLPVGSRFMVGSKVFEKIEPVYESGPKGRNNLRGNCRNLETGGLVRGSFGMVHVVDEEV